MARVALKLDWIRAVEQGEMYKPSFLRRLLGPAPPRAGMLGRAAARNAASLCHALLSERGEVSGARIAREALAAYQALDEAALGVFFSMLASEFSADASELGLAADAYRAQPSYENFTRLQRAVESPRQELFRRLNMASGGIGVLLEMRRRLLRGLTDQPHWTPVEADLGHLFHSWFNRGFLVLQRIDWHTSAIVLEKLIRYEAVHEIQGWGDLRRRLQADRRCYAFFHPALPDEPVIFIEVALTRGMSAKAQALLDPGSPALDPAAADCAIFYSITNCQEGLRGISFGNLLIKQVAEDLGREFPRLKIFATLSPIPGFRTWLASGMGLADSDPRRAEISALLARLDSANWFEDQSCRRQLSRLCAFYLVHAKQGKEPIDPVARFHLGNGARLERLNWLGDTSVAGMRRSAGLMVNYVYRLDHVERNHEAYAKDHRVIASRRFAVLAKDSLLMKNGAPRHADAARAAPVD